MTIFPLSATNLHLKKVNNCLGEQEPLYEALCRIHVANLAMIRQAKYIFFANGKLLGEDAHSTQDYMQNEIKIFNLQGH